MESLLVAWGRGQFYIIWPIVFLTALRFNSLKLLGLTGTGVFLGLQFFPFTNLPFWLGHVIVRPSILLLGTGIALLEITLPISQIYALKYFLQTFGLGLLFAGFLSHWGNWNFGIVLLTASFLVAVPKQNSVIPKILSLFPLPQIGLLSYSIYIWQFVPIKFGKLLIQNQDLRLLVTAASLFILSFVSFTYVEKPLQRYFMRFERS